jgi:type III secretion protein C
MLTYSVVDQDLHDVLEGVVGELGLRVHVSDKVKGRVHGRLAPAPAQQMLDRLAAIYGFDWYCDGDAVYVSAPGEFTSRMLPLGAVDADRFTTTLASLGISDDRWKPRLAADDRIVLVDGPPRYVALVQQTLDALSRRDHDAPQTVHVFRGTAASAP